MRPSRRPALKIATSALVLGLVFQGAAAAAVADARVERTGPDALTVTWTSKDPVDVYVVHGPTATLAGAKPLFTANRHGRVVLTATLAERPHILLRDRSDGVVTRVAERVLPLQQGSNFRDIGGYATTDGRHVKWGRIYRSGATAMLTEADLGVVRSTGILDLVDLRSSEERVLAPTRINGVRYSAVGYSMTALSGAQSKISGDDGMHAIYRGFPTLLAPQLKVLFAALLKEEGPVAYNCSAGQDRTGFATAMILTALGVPRPVILQDYHLSTAYRRPIYEMPRINVAAHPDNPAAALFARVQDSPHGKTAQPLYDSQHQALLGFALAEVEARYGSVEAYLDKEVGVDAADIAKLRAAYLE